MVLNLQANVETFIVFRSCTPLLVAIADSVFVRRPWPSLETFGSLLAILGGAVAYAAVDSAFSVTAYSWAFAYLLCITFEVCTVWLFGPEKFTLLPGIEPSFACLEVAHLMNPEPSFLMNVCLSDGVHQASGNVCRLEHVGACPLQQPPRTGTRVTGGEGFGRILSSHSQPSLRSPLAPAFWLAWPLACDRAACSFVFQLRAGFRPAVTHLDE